ncbi:MAG TPA: hypothetical protein VJK28_00685 [Nitrospiria bacterium]|nr:hypothetical protein [Nitrospiria bacterium]
MRYWKMGWMLGLAAILLSGCGPKDECDDPTRVISQLTGAAGINFYDASSNFEIAQGFTPDKTFNLTSISVFIKKVGDPQGSLRFSIRRDNGGEPEDSPISGGGPQSVGADSISDVSGELKIEFPNEPELNDGTVYHLVISSTEPVNSTNYFVLEGNSGSDVYANGKLSRFDDEDGDGNKDEDEEWTAFTNEDLKFIIEGCEVN